MITSMYEVKRANGGFDGESSTQPDATFDSTLGYSVGFNLLVTDGTDWTCTDATAATAVWSQNTVNDARIEASVISMTELLFDYLNDPFFGNRSTDGVFLSNTVFAGKILTSTGDFLLTDSTLRFYPGDNIRIVGSIRNDEFYDISACDADSFTVDRDFSLDITDPSSVFFSLVSWPSGLSTIVASMIAFDVYTRDN